MKKDHHISPVSLRHQAEQRMKKKPAHEGEQMAATESARLIYELEVSHIELEMQNEELLRSRAAAQDAVAKYTELYDFAPTGYFTLSRTGTILEINLFGARLLGRDREQIKNFPFGSFVSRTSKHAYEQFLQDIFHHKSRQSCEINLITSDSATVCIQLAGIITDKENGCFVTASDVTSLNQSRVNLKESENRYKALFQDNFSVMMLIDPDSGQILDANPSASRYYGWSHDELCQKSISDINTLSVEEVSVEMQKAVNEKRNHFLFRHRLASGEIRDVEVYSGPVTMGNTRLLYSIVHDITEQNHAKTGLQKSEESYRKLVETLHEVVYESAMDGTIRYISPVVKKILGYDRHDLVGTNFLGIVYEQDIPMVAEIMAELAEKVHPFIEFRFVASDSRLVWVRSSATLIMENGSVTGLIGSFTDITELKDQETELQNSEERYSKAFLTSPYSVTITRLEDGKFVEVNDTFLKWSGYTKEEALAEGFGSANLFVDWSDREKVLTDLKEGKAVTDMEVLLKEKHGRIRTVLLSSHIIRLHSKPYILTSSNDITDRKRVENDLRESEELLNSVIQTARDSIFIKDESLRYVKVNNAMAELFGMPVADVLGKSDTDLFGAANADHIEEIDRQVLAGSTVEEYPSKPVKGEIRHFHTIKVPLRDFHGNINGLCGIARDITGRKEAEDLLRMSEGKYRNIFESVQDVYYEATLDGILLEVSPSIEIISRGQYTRDELIGRSFVTLYANPGDRDVFYAEIIEHGRVVDYELLLKNKDGSDVPVSVSARLLFDATGRPAKITGSIRDITERRLAMDSLHASEALYRGILEASPDNITITDLSGKIIMLSDVGLTMFAIPKREEVIGHSISEYIIPEDRERATRNINLMLQGLRHGPKEYTGLRADGVTFDIEVNGEFIRDALGEPTSLVYVVRDITQRKATDKALLQSEGNLNYAQEISAMGSWKYDLVSGEYTWSKNNYKLLGFKPFEKEVTLEYFMSLVYPDDLPVLQASMDEMIMEKIPVNTDMRINMPDGTVRWIQNFIVPVFHEDNLVAMNGVNIDITDKKKAEQEIQELNAILALTVDERTNQLAAANEKLQREIEERKNAALALEQSLDRLAKITSNLPGAVYQFRMLPDRTFYFPYISDGVRDILSIGPDEIVADPSSMYRLIPDDELTGFLSTVNASASEMKLWHHEFMIRRKDGTVRWLLGRALPQREDDNSVLWNGFMSDITERKRIEEELMRLTTRLSLATRAGNIGVWDYDIVNDTLVWDEQMYSLYGISHNDFRGTYEVWTNALHPEDRIRGDEEIRMAIAGKKEFDIEFRILWPDGSLHNIRAYAIVNRSQSGEPLHMVGTNWDITAQKQAEIALEQTRRNYETFFNTIEDFLFVLDEKGSIIHTNTTVIKRLGYTEEELIGQSVLMVHPEERREEANRIVGEMLQGTADFCPVPLRAKTGEYLPVETRVKPGFWDGKNVIFGVSKDISKIKLSEEKFSKAFHSNSALMAISGFEDGFFIDINEKFLTTLGYTREEVIGKRATDINLFPDQTVRWAITERIKLREIVRDVEMDVRTKSGSFITGLFSAEPMFIGKDLCLLTVMVDISDRKRAEQEIRKAKREADMANRAKSEFISRMSHELRTPMNSILGFAQLMGLGDLSPSHRKGVDHILNSGKHLLNLINEVLDISRIEAGRLSLLPEPVQLTGIIHEILDIVHPYAGQRDVTLSLEESPVNLLLVMADRQRLRQVLLNLVNNAIKYNLAGGSVVIKTELRQEKDAMESFVRISVMDSGLGIKKEDIEKLFQPFERIGAEKTGMEGTGLGLTLVKELMEAMGGKIGVESVLDKGSIFWVELTRYEGKKHRAGLTEDNTTTSVTSLNRSGTVLHIEDNVPNAKLVEGILSSHRPSVRLVTLGSGIDAVNVARQSQPDLIFLDLDLPDMHGTDLLDALLKDEATKLIPVVIISADAIPDKIQQLKNAGARDYLAKPFDIIEFLELVDQWIDKPVLQD